MSKQKQRLLLLEQRVALLEQRLPPADTAGGAASAAHGETVSKILDEWLNGEDRKHE